jgi:hypothetical protein
MSRRETTRPPTIAPCLVVPAVDVGDVGLVVTVHELDFDGGYKRWHLVTSEGRRYILPPELHPWARRLHSDVRQRFIKLPTRYAFAKAGGDVAARRLWQA